MGKYCSDCKYLSEKKKKVDGIYFCQKQKKFLPACMEACSKFDKDYSRRSFRKQELYDLGKKALKNSPEVSNSSIVFLLIAVLFGFIAWILGY